MIRLYCKRGHFIADVDINDKGHVIPRGIRHGLSWGYNPDRDISCIRAKCFKRSCPCDVSKDYLVLCAAVADAAARGDTKHTLTT